MAGLVLEVALRTGFTEAFTHLTDRSARTADFALSLCAALLEACNTGPEPFIRHDTSALRRDRIGWVKQNYLRDETITAGNATLVAAQNRMALAHAWGGDEIASAFSSASGGSIKQFKVARRAREDIQLGLRCRVHPGKSISCTGIARIRCKTKPGGALSLASGGLVRRTGVS